MFPLEVLDTVAKRLSIQELKKVIVASKEIRQKTECTPLIWKRYIQSTEHKLRSDKYIEQVKTEYEVTKQWKENTKCRKSTEHMPGVPVTKMKVYGDMLVVSSDSPTVRIYDTNMNEISKLDGHKGAVWTFDCQETLLATGSTDRTAKIWDCLLGICIKTLVGHTATVRCVKFAEEGYVITGARDSTIRIWCTKTGACRHVLRSHKENVRAIEVIKDKPLFVSASYDGNVILWNYRTGECVKHVGAFARRVYALCEVNNCIAMGGSDKIVKIVPVWRDKKHKEECSTETHSTQECTNTEHYTDKHESTVFKIYADQSGCIYTLTVAGTITKWCTKKRKKVYEIAPGTTPVEVCVLNHLLVVGISTGILLYCKSTGKFVRTVLTTNRMYAMCTTQEMLFWAARRIDGKGSMRVTTEVCTIHYK